MPHVYYLTNDCPQVLGILGFSSETPLKVDDTIQLLDGRNMPVVAFVEQDLGVYKDQHYLIAYPDDRFTGEAIPVESFGSVPGWRHR